MLRPLTFNLTQRSLAMTYYFSSEYYQVLTATHLPTPEGWKAELA